MNAGVASENPFLGLRPFEPKDSTLFFGRDVQIGEALERLLRQRLVAVVGVSGCGKSSLVGAGIVPALEMGLAGDPEQRWRVATMRPGDGPLRELRRCLGIRDKALADRTYGLLDAVETQLTSGENLLLVVDQFEEIFPFRDRKLREGAGCEADLFVSYLLRAVQDQGRRVCVLLTMRSDYLGECAKFHGLPEALNDGQYLVPRMTRQQLQEAIECPLDAVGVKIHPTLVQDLLNQCDEEPDNLPLLQHLLRRMFEQWERDGGQGSITSDLSKRVGGLAESLDWDAEKVYGALSSGEQLVAEALFKRITESTRSDREEEDRPVRRPVTLVELTRLAEVSEHILRSVVSPFEERGLLTLRSTDLGEKADLPHECLCLKWKRLKTWVKEEADSAAIYERLADSSAAGFETYRGTELDQALKWKRKEGPNAVWALRYRSGEETFERAIEFLDRSSRAREEAVRLQNELIRLRRIRVAAIAIGVGFLVTTALSVYGYLLNRKADQQRQLSVMLTQEADRQRTIAEKQREFSLSAAQQEKALHFAAEEDKTRAQDALQIAVEQTALANSARLASASLLNKDARTDLAALLAVEARRLADSFEARNALLLSLQSPLKADISSTSGMLNVVFSPDGKMLASAGEDGSVYLWDIVNRKQVKSRKDDSGHLRTVAFSPDGKILVSSSDNGVLQLLDVADFQQQQTLGRGSAGNGLSVAFSPDGKILASAGHDGTVMLWDLPRSQQLAVFNGHTGDVLSVAFGPDGKILASAGHDGTVLLWDVASHRQLGSLDGHEEAVRCIAFSPDGKALASASDDGTMRLWDVTHHQPLDFVVRFSGKVENVVFSPDGKLLASASDDNGGTVRLWDVVTRQELGIPLQQSRSGVIRSLAFSPNSKILASAGEDHSLTLFDVGRRQYLESQIDGHSRSVKSLAFSPNGNILASAGEDGTVRLWDVARHMQLSNPLETDPLAKEPDWVNAVSISADGKVLASESISYWQKSVLQLWALPNGRELGGPSALGSEYFANGGEVAFSNDGRILAFGSNKDGKVSLWDVANRQLLPNPLIDSSGSIGVVAFSADGKLLASGSAGNTVVLWDVTNRRQLASVKGGTKMTTLAFSPDGKILASAGCDQMVRLWDLERHQLKGSPLNQPFSCVRSLAFSPDSSLLASAGDEGLWLWDMSHRQQLGKSLEGLSYGVDAVAFSPDGKKVASGGEDGTVELWDIDPDSWTAHACRLASRNLSLAEWQQFIGLNVPYRRTCPDLPPGDGAPTS